MKESFQQPGQSNEAARLAGMFKEMGFRKTKDQHVFEELEDDLEQAKFSLAETGQVFEIMHNRNFLCRSESFEKVMNLLMRQADIQVVNHQNDANMCVMAGGDGFRVAMTEGFSGKDVNGLIKTVITFRGEHLVSAKPIERESPLWESKKKTAEVSLSGRGVIIAEDIEMVSFRFPVQLFPKELLNEDEVERLDDEKIFFVVRHYVR